MTDRLAKLRRRVNRARHFPHNTDPYSRHVQMMADQLSRGKRCYMIEEEPVHAAESMLATVASLWELRSATPRYGLEWRARLAMMRAASILLDASDVLYAMNTSHDGTWFPRRSCTWCGRDWDRAQQQYDTFVREAFDLLWLVHEGQK